MNTATIRNFFYSTLIGALVVLAGTLPVSAEERVTTSVAPEYTAESVEAAPTNYNNTRSNRSTVTPPDNDTDVACGSGQVRCPDGSCAAATDRCAVGSVEAVPYRADSTHCAVGDDCDDGDPQVKPGEAVSMPDDSCGIDDDCDGRTDEEPYLENDDDGDGYGEPENRAQSHNSSRSNRTEGVAAPDDADDNDDDDDGVPTTRSESADDKATPLLYESLRQRSEMIDGVPLVLDVVESSVEGEVTMDTETSEPRLGRLSVSAEGFRSWGDGERAAFQEVLAQAEEDTPEYTSLKITEQVLGNERIESLEASDTGVQTRYRARIRLLGFIPIERTVEARTTETGEVEVEYPWYRFLSAAPDTETIQELLSNTQAFFR